MKVRPTATYFDQIRNLIESVRQGLAENKRARKSLQAQIAEKKATIKGLERVASINDLEGVDPHGLVRKQARVLEKEVVVLRQDLLAAEVYRSIEIGKFHILHEQLDKFSVPFNPSAKQKKKKGA